MRYVPATLFILLVVISQAVGCKKTEDKTIHTPEVKKDPDPTTVIAISHSGIPVKGQKLKFWSNTPDSINVKWDMGTGTILTSLDSPYYNYGDTGHYTIRLLTGETTLASKEIFIDKSTYKFGFEGKLRRWKHLIRTFKSHSTAPAFAEGPDAYFEITGINDTLKNPYTRDIIYQDSELNADTLHIETNYPTYDAAVYLDYAYKTDNIYIKYHDSYNYRGDKTYTEHIYYTY